MFKINATEEPQHKNDRDYWGKIIHQFQASGLTQKKFCAENNIAHGTFKNWVYRLRVNHQNPLKQSKPLFTPIAVKQDLMPSHSINDAQKSPSEPPFILELPDAKKIIIPSVFKTDSLQRLLQVIGGTSC